MNTLNTKTKLLIGLSLLTAGLAACSPAPISDEQARLITAECAKRGMATHIFNTILVSRIDCIESIIK